VSRVVVIGAGMGGLATAVRLAASGHVVRVVEQADVVGGKLGTVSARGHTFGTGPSLLTMPHLYRELFAATGRPLDVVLDLVRLDPACRYRFADGLELDLPGHAEDIPDALGAALGDDAAAQWAAFMARAERIWQVVHEPFLESPLTPAGLARRARRIGDLRTVAPWASLRSLGAHYLPDPRLRALLDRYATYTGSDPRLAPAALATVPYVEQRWGSWYVHGGLRRLADALADRAGELGVEISTGTPAARISLTAGRADGVRLANGEHLPADVVIANADAANVYGELLPPAVARSARRALQHTTPSLSGFTLLLALDRADSDPVHHRVLFGDDYDDEFDSVFGSRRRRPRPAPTPTIYVSAPDDPALRPDESSSSWYVLVNAPRHDPSGGVDWDAPGVADRYRDHVLSLLAARGLDVRDRVRWSTVRTPADLERSTWSPGGSIYGSSSNGARAAFLRPSNRSPVPGLFLVGGSAHPGGGLPLVELSARIVAGLVGPA
jgi:phytoene desaturase